MQALENRPTDDLVPINSAPTEYPVGYSTLTRWIRNGRLEPLKFPLDQRTYVRRADILRLLEDRRSGQPG